MRTGRGRKLPRPFLCSGCWAVSGEAAFEYQARIAADPAVQCRRNTSKCNCFSQQFVTGLANFELSILMGWCRCIRCVGSICLLNRDKGGFPLECAQPYWFAIEVVVDARSLLFSDPFGSASRPNPIRFGYRRNPFPDWRRCCRHRSRWADHPVQSGSRAAFRLYVGRAHRVSDRGANSDALSRQAPEGCRWVRLGSSADTSSDGWRSRGIRQAQERSRISCGGNAVQARICGTANLHGRGTRRYRAKKCRTAASVDRWGSGSSTPQHDGGRDFNRIADGSARDISSGFYQFSARSAKRPLPNE